MKALNTFIIIILISSAAWAQDENIFSLIGSSNSKGGKVHVFQDAQIRNTLDDYVKHKKSEEGMQGFRVQIYFGSGHTSRENANNVRNAFVSKYQDTPVHVVFQEPYFKVRVGDFRTKSEALKVLKEIETDYEGAFIVKDYIELPDL
jgi:hypothetical protein